MYKTQILTSDLSVKPYVDVCDIAISEVTSGVYVISKSLVQELEGRFIDSQAVVRIMEDDSRAVLCGLQYATTNFELSDSEKGE